MSRNFKVLLAFMAVLIIAGGAYAFAAANTIEASAGGYKDAVVSGYTVTGVVYDLDATDPTTVDAITFSISPSTGAVVAAIVKLQTVTAGTWKDCTLVAGTAPAMACDLHLRCLGTSRCDRAEYRRQQQPRSCPLKMG